MYKYFKKWKEHPDKLKAEGEPIDWFGVSKEDMVTVLEGAYRDANLVIEQVLHDGHVVNTPFSLFKAEKNS